MINSRKNLIDILHKNISFLVLFSSYWILRTIKLTSLPIFCDEAIFLRFAQLIHSDISYFFISMVDDVEPLFHVLNALLLFIFEDPLVSGRMVSVIAGAANLILLYIIGKTIYSQRVALIACSLYIFCPYFFFHDRMSLMDSLQSTFALLAFLFAYQIVKRDPEHLNWSLYIGLGLALGLGIFTKPIAIIYLTIFPWLWLLLSRGWLPIKKIWLSYLIWAVFFLPTYLAPIPGLDHLGFKGVIEGKHFFMTSSELFSFPLDIWLKNILKTGAWFSHYLTLPIVLIFLGLMVRLFFIRKIQEWLLPVWSTGVIFLMIILGKVTFSRYILFAVILLLLPLAAGFELIFSKLTEKLKIPNPYQNLIFLLVISAILIPALKFDYLLWKDPVQANWTEDDREQYISGYPAGYGIPEIRDYLLELAQKGPVTLFVTDKWWGIPEDALYVYLKDKPKIEVIEAWWADKGPLLPAGQRIRLIYRISKYFKDDVISKQMQNLGKVFFVCRSDFTPLQVFQAVNPNSFLIRSFQKPGGKSGILLFSLINPNDHIQKHN